MVDLDQILEWLFMASALVVIPLLVTGGPSRRREASDRLERFGAWVLRHIRKDEASDGVDDELAEALRQEQLGRDLRRLQRLTLTDESMSATRQMANRLAYEKLRHQLEASSHPARLTSALSTADTASRAASPVHRDLFGSRRQEPNPETIEISWRS